MATVWLASTDFADAYCFEGLGETDMLRIQAHPALAQRLDWRVSRALKRQVQGEKILSLSHSCGTAALLTDNASLIAGIDIEFCRSRDFERLADWVMTPQERCRWQVSGSKMHDFYCLWTLKEALLKATNGVFPEDMKKVGLHIDRQGLCTLFAAGSVGVWRGQTRFIAGYAVSCVWQGNGSAPQWNILGNLAQQPLTRLWMPDEW